MTGYLLCYRAGPKALHLLRREGLKPGMIRAVVGPASGPRWLVLEALDRALLSSGLLHSGRILLAGSSAGAWRMMAFASRRPLEVHQRLLRGYVRQVFPPGASPEVVSAAYRDLLQELFAEERDHILAHPTFDLAVHTCRLRRGRSKASFLASFFAAAVFRTLTSRSTDLFFERILKETQRCQRRERPKVWNKSIRLGASPPQQEHRLVIPLGKVLGKSSHCLVDLADDLHKRTTMVGLQ